MLQLQHQVEFPENSAVKQLITIDTEIKAKRNNMIFELPLKP